MCDSKMILMKIVVCVFVEGVIGVVVLGGGDFFVFLLVV